jgi:hypothetical protein
MSTNLITERDISNALEERFDPTSPFIYQTVILLLLYWKDADLDFRGEADAMDRLFRNRFHYSIILLFEMPSKNSSVALNDEFQRVNRMFNTRTRSPSYVTGATVIPMMTEPRDKSTLLKSVSGLPRKRAPTILC